MSIWRDYGFPLSKLGCSKRDVLTLFSEFFTNGNFVASLDTTFIGLIPKKVDAENIRD